MTYGLKLKEADITRQIRDLLNQCKVFHWKAWQGPMSQPKGVSDIIGIYKGRFLAIEVKQPGKQPTKAQADFLTRVNDAGGIGFVACGVEDVIRILGLNVEVK